MSVQHFPRNSSIAIPIDIPLYSGITALTGEAANLSLVLVCLDNGYTLDNADGQFRTSPASPSISLVPYTDYPNDYFTLLTQSNWPRGHYRAKIHHSAGDDYNFDFTLGIFVPRSLGYSAVYSGGQLTISAWIEELGVVQNDYTSLSSCMVLDSFGNMLADGNFGTNSSPNNGVFNFSQSVSLQPSNAYSFLCNAVVPGAPTRGSMTFALQAGLARP